MSWTTDETTRIQNLEATQSKLLIAVGNLGTKRMLHQLLAVLQEENRVLRADLADLKTQVDLLKANR